MKLPPLREPRALRLTQEPILHVDATPDEGYPLRILRAYRQDADCMWADNTGGSEPQNPIMKLMNDNNRERAEILDRAIKKLAEREA